MTVALGKIFTLECHAMLDRNPSSQHFNPLDIGFSNGLCVVENPVQTVERELTINLLEYVQHTADRFV